MNMWTAVGRIVRADVNNSQTGIQYIRFCLATDRPKQKGEEKAQSDYVDCVIFGKSCGYFQKYIEIGDTVSVYGPMRSGSYEKNGVKVSTLNCNVMNYALVKKSGVKQAQAAPMPQQQPTPPAPPPVFYQQQPQQAQPVQHCPPAPQPQTWPEPPPENIPFDIYGY